MSIPKKGSRKVVVDGVAYGWRVRKRPTYCQGLMWTTMVLAVERVDCRGCVMIAELPKYHPSNWISKEAGLAATPDLVVEYIRKGLKEGWQPSERGAQFKLVGSSIPETPIVSGDNSASD